MYSIHLITNSLINIVPVLVAVFMYPILIVLIIIIMFELVGLIFIIFIDAITIIIIITTGGVSTTTRNDFTNYSSTHDTTRS